MSCPAPIADASGAMHNAVVSAPNRASTLDSEGRLEEAIEPLAGPWDELADRVGAPPFLRPGWIAAWWRAFGSGDLEILSLQRGEILDGLLPLARRRRALTSPTNYHSPVFGPLAKDAPAARELVLDACSRRLRRVEISLLDEDDPSLEQCRAGAESAGYRVLMRRQSRTPFLALDGDWDTYRGRLHKNLRNDLRRQRRRLNELGEVTVELADGSERLEPLLGEMFSIEGSGWKDARGTAIASRPETRRFYEEIAEWAACRGSLRLWFLRLDGRPVASDICLEEGGVCYLLKAGYDPQFRRYSPGNLILGAIIEHCFASRLDRIELGGGVGPYKLRWAETIRDRRLLQAFRRSPPGLFEWAAFAYGRPAAKRLLRRDRD